MMVVIIKCIKVISAIICSVVTFFLGGFDAVLKILLCMMLLDYVTGVMCAIKLGTLSSETGFSGLLKKLGMILIVALSHLTGEISGVPEVRSLVIGFYIANEGISILENAGRLGVPMPKKLVDVLMQLKGE